MLTSGYPLFSYRICTSLHKYLYIPQSDSEPSRPVFGTSTGASPPGIQETFLPLQASTPDLDQHGRQVQVLIVEMGWSLLAQPEYGQKGMDIPVLCGGPFRILWVAYTIISWQNVQAEVTQIDPNTDQYYHVILALSLCSSRGWGQEIFPTVFSQQ